MVFWLWTRNSLVLTLVLSNHWPHHQQWAWPPLWCQRWLVQKSPGSQLRTDWLQPGNTDRVILQSELISDLPLQRSMLWHHKKYSLIMMKMATCRIMQHQQWQFTSNENGRLYLGMEWAELESFSIRGLRTEYMYSYVFTQGKQNILSCSLKRHNTNFKCKVQRGRNKREKKRKRGRKEVEMQNGTSK